MNSFSIVICDEDELYLDAFCRYITDNIRDADIYTFSDPKSFIETKSRYDIGIMTKDFLSVMEFAGVDNVIRKFYLSNDKMDTEFNHLPNVYKYQSMEIVEEMIKRCRQKDSGNWIRAYKNASTDIYGVYSPISHELQLPFCLAMSEYLSKDSRVLLIDIEELSILQSLTGMHHRKNMMDLLYIVSEDEQVDISDYVSSFMGIDYINPFAGPEEISDIDEQTWVKFLEYLSNLGYDSIVILFGRMISGFRNIVSGLSDIYVLGKPGEYYRKSQSRFIEYLDKSGIETSVSEVLLPMNASNLTDGSYGLEELISGNLGLFVRRFLQQKDDYLDAAYA